MLVFLPPLRGRRMQASLQGAAQSGGTADEGLPGAPATAGVLDITMVPR